MITVNENILNMLKAPARRISGRVELYNCSALQNDGYNRELLDTYCSNDELIEFKVERVSDDGKFFGFGICQKLIVKLRDPERRINIQKGQVLEVSFGVEGDFTYPCPLFRVEEVSRDESNNNLTVTAFDFLYKANEHYVADLGLTSYNLHTFATACAKALNLPIKLEPDTAFRTSYYNGANFQGDETIREALNAVAEATQTIYFVDNDWRLTFKRIDKNAEPVLMIDKTQYFELKSKTDRTLTSICHATELGDNITVSTNEPGVTQYVRNNPFWDLREDIDTLLNDAIAAIGGTTISQYDLSWRGNYAIEIGDKIAITTKNNDTLVGYVLNDTLTYNGGLQEHTKWEFIEYNAETADNPVSLGEVLRNTYARVNKAEGRIELMAKETQETLDGYEERFSAITLTTDGITQEVSRVEQKIDSVKSEIEGGIDGEVATIKSELNSKIEQTASGINATISQLDTKIDNSTTQMSNNITATANSLTTEINKVDKKIDNTTTTLNSKIAQTESSIATEISKVDKKIDNTSTTLNSKINQTVESITSEIESVEVDLNKKITTLNSSIQQTNNSITSTVSKVEQLEDQTSTLSSQIEQTAESIDLKVDKNGIISAINMSPETIDIAASKLNLSGYTTFTDLSTYGKTTINGSNITTGTISADRINLTGAIGWSDLDSDTQDAIEDIEGTANAAYLLASQSGSFTLPNYIKSTYIDSAEIRSPTIKGNDIKVYNTFQTIGYNGSTEFVSGYVGAARGEDAAYNTTYGVAMSNEWNPSTLHVGTNYIIVTNAGVRLQSGNNNVVVTNNTIRLNAENGKAYYNGVEIGGADYVVETGTSGVWTYRKWNSGIAECWCKRSVSTTINTAWGSLYTSGALSGTNVTLPFTFAEVPNVNVSLYNNAAGAFIMVSGSWNPPTTTTTGAYELARGNALTTSYSFGFNYQVMGRWK